MFGDIFNAIALWYGYRTIYLLLSENFGLVVVLVAFIAVMLFFYKAVDKVFARSPRRALSIRISRAMVIFGICGFIFIAGLTLFYERKNIEKNADLLPVASITSNLPV